MSTPQHLLHGVILGKISVIVVSLFVFIPTCIAVFIIGVFGIMGGINDILPAVENTSFNANKWTKWESYKKHHTYNKLCIFPSYFLHIFLDSFTHGEGKRWWIVNERLSWEIVGIILSVLLITFLFSI